ncbi:bifunctional phosphoribosyl-AMP cyclohydrolase/phosphoribosyl-ATP diphosphatase HisIE [Niameybacter massiliensis]|uniref:Histidine biosynthesis bifunctional protein HisIE n=1 Tax=Holtiella tumoricola TaxID=3018743 RepID=A0AA42DLU5_9FIRM|nr:bifunctional phosphoribosyl-AMP cyclohydrolase/phosphoribosyl-ATP diphosphatase HisIE [Holtiella tumoricola]MDA3731444.1 bifunctional phosphoribosyl-AMP cyclohydrolase/phosphoribosyl-ATP diphosphatase HisIE [Holtiella tumoricola]
MTQQEFLNQIRFDEKGLVPVITQDAHAKKVRMLAYMNREALEKTLETGKVHYYSRSRKSLWLKGETSGHFQYLKSMSVDCDGDTLLIQIDQEGGISCHTGHATCFFTTLDRIGNVQVTSLARKASGHNMLTELQETILERKLVPQEGSYTNYLFEKGVNKILKKVGEEASEVIIAAKDKNPEELTGEIADLMYHLTVLMVEEGVCWEDVQSELDKRK